MSAPAASASILDRIVARTQRLYSLPSVAARVLELTSGDVVDATEIKECIELDPALTVKILRVANSSLFGLRTEVQNLNQAIGLLGIRSLKMLVLGFSLPSELVSNVPTAVLERFWRHTVYRAVAARRFAQRLWHIPGDDAFLAGLLSGVGMLALIQQMGDTYTQFLEHLNDHGGDLAEQEVAVLGFDHMTLSARMLEHWGLPAVLFSAVGRPRKLAELLPHRLNDQPLPAVLHLANLAAEFLAAARPARLQALLYAAADLKNVSAEEMQRAIAEFEEEAAQLSALFQIPPPESGAFERMFMQAHASLAQLAEESILASADQQASQILEQATELQEELRLAMSHAAQRITAPTKELRGDAAAAAPQAHVPARPKGIPTGEAALAGAVLAAVEQSRAERCPLSLILLAVDDYNQVVIEVGSSILDEVLAWLLQKCCSFVDDEQHVLSLGKARFAILLQGQDRAAAASSARQLLDQARGYLRRYVGTASRPVKVSLGLASVALPPRNFSERQLLEAARRCLQAAQSSGGDVVKSIELLR